MVVAATNDAASTALGPHFEPADDVLVDVDVDIVDIAGILGVVVVAAAAAALVDIAADTVLGIPVGIPPGVADVAAAVVAVDVVAVDDVADVADVGVAVAALEDRAR